MPVGGVSTQRATLHQTLDGGSLSKLPSSAWDPDFASWPLRLAAAGLAVTLDGHGLVHNRGRHGGDNRWWGFVGVCYVAVNLPFLTAC